MRRGKITNTDLEVSPISLGSWVFGGDCWGETDDSESVDVVKEAIAGGINMIDTAPVYGNGRSESVIGRAIQGRRDRVTVATKCGLEVKGASMRINLSAGFIRKDAEASLRRLGIETIDLYQCHWPDKDTPLEETFGEMLRLQKEGKIRYIGVCNFDRALLSRALAIAPVVSDQVQYSLFDRSIEQDLLSFCGERSVSILAYGALGGGMLTGKYKEPPVFNKGDARSFFYKYYREPFWSKGKRLVSSVEEIAASRGVPVAGAAINWVLSHDEVVSCIVGNRTRDQLRKNLSAAEWDLSGEELRHIQEEYD
ncbi:MAG: aldo/keto reductase, partial [Candidatus Omnitrophica bacterium]|nr:aldo/keto reductase [Candidatus Omnitrophota bacterium]